MTPPPSSCPNGSDPNDGCAGAPATAQFIFPNFLTDSQQSGQTFLVNPNSTYNQAGIQYAIGPTFPQSSGLDPLDPANYPPAVGFDSCDPQDFTTYWVIACHGANVPAWTWTGLNFGPFPGRTAGPNPSNTGPVYLNFNNSVVSSQNFIDDWWSVDNNCGQPAQKAFVNFQINGNVTGPHVYRNVAFDGNNPVCQLMIMNGIIDLTDGDKTLERFYFNNIQGRAINFHGTTTTDDVVRWGMINGGCGFGPWQGHGECSTFGVRPLDTYNSLSISYVATNLSKVPGNLYTTIWFPTDGSTSTGTLASFVLNKTINIVNSTNGWTGALAGTFTGHIDIDPATGLGNLLVCDSGCTPLAPGTFVQIGGSNKLGTNILFHISGSGVGSKWTLACQEPAFDSHGVATCANSATQSPTQNNIDVPDVTYATQTLNWQNGTASGGCLEPQNYTYGQMTITSNFCDRTGSQTAQYWHNLGDCTNPTIWTLPGVPDNKDLVTGATINAWSVNSGIGC